MKKEKKEKEKMQKGRIVGYAGIALIVAILLFLGVRYLLSNKGTESEKDYNNEVVSYQKLVCKSSNSYDEYTTSNAISMSFEDNELVWIYASHDYFYLSSEAFAIALSDINTRESTSTTTYQSSEDYLTISEICEGDASVVSECLTDTTDTSYINLYKYFKNKGYSCEE